MTPRIASAGVRGEHSESGLQQVRRMRDHSFACIAHLVQ